MEKEILREMWDSRKGMWKITKKTSNGAGGWKSYGAGPAYASKQSAQDKINWLCEKYPDQYTTEQPTI